MKIQMRQIWADTLHAERDRSTDFSLVSLKYSLFDKGWPFAVPILPRAGVTA